MTSWQEFAAAAPKIATIFRRRHAATGNLCMLATSGRTAIRGSARSSRASSRTICGWWVCPGPPSSAIWPRDPRFCLHTATVDSYVGDGDAKLWGVVRDVPDAGIQQRFAAELFAETGLDQRGQEFDHFYAAGVTGASAVEFLDGHLEVTIWNPGRAERVVRKN